jgi:hypothetical protein
MSPEVLKFVILAIVVLIIVLVAGYYIVRFMRGSIKITLAKNSFNEGEQITGSFELTTRKEIEGNRLFVTLRGQEVTKERRGGKPRTYTREIYRDELTIEEAKTFPAGQTTNYDFQLATPSSAGPDFLDSPLGKTLKVGMELLGGRRSYLRWMVEAKLDAKGVDLASRRKVTVNMSSLET